VGGSDSKRDVEDQAIVRSQNDLSADGGEKVNKWGEGKKKSS
jgi:hypothetical protein